MARALAERVRVRPLIHLDRQTEGGDFQCTEVAAAVIEVFRDRGVLHRRVRTGISAATARSHRQQDGHTACAADCSRD